MATDMFGNILTPEEEERLRRHSEAMGMLPPAVRIQMTAPFGGGIGPQSYSGVTGPFEAIPSDVPDIIQPGEEVISPTTIDPTMAGMATVSQNYGDFSPHMGMLGDMVSNQPTVDYSIVTDDPTRPVVTDTPFSSNMPEITPSFESNMPTVNPSELQTPAGMVQASHTGGLGNYDHLGNLTSINPQGPFRLPSYSGTGTGGIGPIDITVPVAPGLMLGGSAAAATAKAIAESEGVQPGEPYSGMGDAPDPMFTGHPGMLGATGYDLSGTEGKTQDEIDVDTQVDTFAGMGAVPAMSDPTGGLAATDPSLQGVTPHSQASVLGDVFSSGVGIIDEGPFVPNNPISVLDKVFSTTPALNWDTIKDLPQTVIPAVFDTLMPTAGADTGTTPAVDTFKDIPAAPTKPAGLTRAELKAAAAAQRKADLAEQKAAARRTELARQALKDSQAAAAKAQAASAAQAKAAQDKARAVLARAAGRDRGGPSQAEINAAIEVMSQVDSFGAGAFRNTRGEVGMDETGYTDTSGYGVG